MTGSRSVAAGFTPVLAFVALLALAGGPLGAAVAVAQDDFQITMSLDRNEAAVGEPFTVSVEVEHGGVGRAPQPELPPVEGLLRE